MLKFWKNKRKSKIINNKYQLKYIIIFLFLIISAFSTVLYYNIKLSLDYKKTIHDENLKLIEAVKVQEDITNSYIKYAKRVANPDYRIRTEPIKQDNDQAIQNIAKYSMEIEKYIEKNFFLIKVTIGVFALLLFLVSRIIIKLTFRISAPEKIINKMLDDILKGKNPELRNLRKRDNLKEINEKIIKLYDIMNKKA